MHPRCLSVTPLANFAPIHTMAGEDTVIGREKEYAAIKSRISFFFENSTGSVAYITGVPGSGKTHTAMAALDRLKHPFAYVNCSVLKQRAQIYNAIGAALGCVKEKKTTLQSLRAHFHACKEHHVVFVDEVDFLRTPSEAILYNLFEMPFIEDARVFLIAVSNTLESLGARLESRVGRDRIEFRPYSSSDLKSIVGGWQAGNATAGSAAGSRTRLRKELAPIQANIMNGNSKTMDNKSLELITKRVASSTGDIRKVFTIIKRTGASDPRTVDGFIKEIQTPLLDRFIRALSYYQKIVFFLNRDRARNLTGWFSSTRAFCRAHEIAPLDFVAFKDCVDDLVKFGIFQLRGLRVTSQFLPEEFERAMAGDADFAKLRH